MKYILKGIKQGASLFGWGEIGVLFLNIAVMGVMVLFSTRIIFINQDQWPFLIVYGFLTLLYVALIVMLIARVAHRIHYNAFHLGWMNAYNLLSGIKDDDDLGEDEDDDL